MAHSITIKLNKAANEFQAGESVGFSVRGGVQYYDHKTKAKEWTNYSAVIFAKAEGQINFYRAALTEGAIVEIGGKSQKVDVYEGGQNGPSYTIELQDAWLGMINNPNQQAPQQNFAPQQQAPQQQGGFAPQQQPMQSPPGFNQQAYNQQQAQQQPQQGNNQGFPQHQG